MQKFDVKTTYFLLFIFEITKCFAILTGNEQEFHQDITSLPQYGCHWYGGSNAMVNCTCREDAEEFVIRRGDLPVYDTWTVEINKCKNVTFEEHSIEDLRNLRNLNLRQISNLNLKQNSLNWFGYRPTYQSDDDLEDENVPSLKIQIENTNITKISQHAFKGRIREIQLVNCHVNELESFAFTSLQHTREVALRNTIIDAVKPQAFKSFNAKRLILNNVTIDVLPSRSFSNLQIHENFIVTNSKFGTIYSGAFIMERMKWFEVSSTSIEVLDGEAFSMEVRGDVHFRKNHFGVVYPGAFIKITASRSVVANTALYLIVHSNVFTNLAKNSLDVQNGVILKIVNLKLNESCNCEGITSRLEHFKEFFSEIKCLDKDYIALNDYKTVKCTLLAGHLTMIIIIGVISMLLLIMIILLSLYYHKAYREGRYGNDKNEPTKNMSLIVPDGRTYRETEVHVILERADLLTTDL